MEFRPDQQSLNEKAKFSEWHKWWLLFLLLESNQVNHSHWEEFARNITYKNRFSSDSVVVKELIKQAEHATHIVPQGTTFFRARRYERSPYEWFLANWMRKNGALDEEIENEVNNIQPTTLGSHRILSESGTLRGTAPCTVGQDPSTPPRFLSI